MPIRAYYGYLKERTKLLRKRTAHRMKLRLRYWFMRKPICPALILTSRRCGSNYLLDCLNSVPGVAFATEVLHENMSYGIRHKHISKNALKRHIRYSVHGCEGLFCGAKLLKYQVEALRLAPADLASLWPDTRFIILYRKSLLDQYVSIKMAEATQEWIGVRSHARSLSVTVNLPEFREFCDSIRRFYKDIQSDDTIRSHSLVLSYEELIEDTQGVFDSRLFPFLNIPAHPVKPRLVKQNVWPLRDTIQNYDQIQHVLYQDSSYLDLSGAKISVKSTHRISA